MEKVCDSALTERNYGIDLLRIFSMFMVCVLHLLIHGGVLGATIEQSAKYYAASGIEIAAYCAVNCYALISGFVGIRSKYRISNVIYLWLQVAFYSVIIAIVYVIIKPDTYTWKTIVKSFLLVTFNQYWYFTAYFGLFFLIPILNCALCNIPHKRMKYIILIISVAITVFSRLNEDLFALKVGYSTLWLAVLYLIGGYLKMYNPFRNIKSKWLAVSWIGLIVVTWGFKLVVEKLFGKIKYGGMLTSYLSPTIFFIAIVMLELFSRIKFKKKPHIIAFFAPLSFGVYLIHDNPLIRANLIKGRFAFYAEKNIFVMSFAVIGTAIAIYIACSFIDYFRLLLFKLLKIKPTLQQAEIRIKNKVLEEEQCLETTEN